MNISRGDFREYGPRICGRESVIFTFSVEPTSQKISIILFDKSTYKQISTIELTEEYAVGRVYSVEVSGINPDKVCYLLKEDAKSYIDPYATTVVGRDNWADVEARRKHQFAVYSGISHIEKDWKDTKVSIAPSDMVMYKLHMRGFTAGFNMSEAKIGTYKGLVSKLSYLKKLGITSLEIMPIYDFEELFLESKASISPKGKIIHELEYTDKINYWGFGLANYFAPKASYFGGSASAVEGMRSFVGTLHSKGFEVIMEMAFSTETTADMQLACLKYYVKYFHIDGFHIVGCNAPIERIAADPYLANTKIFYEFIPEELLCAEAGRKHLFIYNDSFMNVTRQIQNHMNGSMLQFANHMRRQNSSYGFVNYMANVNGFSLWDSYSYGEKHNYDNGEENRDGTNNNFSFNYGIEGKTTNKTINANRFREMRNAFTALMMSQSVPLFVAADEMAASHMGNNNPYCQDNKIGYTSFAKNKSKATLQRFVTELIEFRKNHKCLRVETPFYMNDYKHLGLPDMSFHGSEPWMMSIGEEQKSLGVLYNGAYVKENEEVFVCYNFHYDSVNMALPLLSPGKRWRLCFNTAEFTEESDFVPKPIHDQQSIKVPGSSISVLVGIKVERNKA
ncbi:alpha-amylase family glycosyl hydrolase [Pseudobutyrivibrio sp. YE44]|uniref:alpha-amylase family glycosyl hydrolase n=1 Tax=Pseudobutyrivibrio sp. YE44 TaxID=1520802 RepID=UPI000B873A33|nr:alpha-amylase family glycosyl hydrolase [Pseudobutyrivibrio sp. YE44]